MAFLVFFLGLLTFLFSLGCFDGPRSITLLPAIHSWADTHLQLIRAFSVPKPAPFTIFDFSCSWIRVRERSYMKTRDFSSPSREMHFNGLCGVWSHFKGKLAEQICKLIFNLPICCDKTAPLSTVVS